MENNTQTVLTLPSVMMGQQTKRTNEWNDAIEDAIIIDEPSSIKHSPFIEANTEEVTISHLQKDCIIPVFAKDNEILISHQNFIESIYEAAKDYYKGEEVQAPMVRVSHIIKGRIPSAISKKVIELTESDKTMYYSRMIFNIDIPTIHQDVNGNQLSLNISGCKSYDRDNLSGKLTPQKFSVAVGFKNKVCTNLCLSTDGFKDEIRAMNSQELYRETLELLGNYNIAKHIHLMQSLGNTYLTEQQFCQILGRMRLQNYLPQSMKSNIPNLLITDSQINNVAKQYIHDENFSGNEGGISMWKFYNLLTGANKSSYIDSFLNRAVNATELSQGITDALNHRDDKYAWFLQ